MVATLGPPHSLFSSRPSRRSLPISCEAAALQTEVKPVSVSIPTDPRVGARVRVKAALKVYHVPRVRELELRGMEGEIKQHIGVWRGKQSLTASLPFRVEFFVQGVEGRGLIRFLAHLKEDEFDYI